jgi:4-diphosphocytidyl-2-C-methyl-D-erythritol kinase
MNAPYQTGRVHSVTMAQLRIKAPAKINLCLEVLGKRPDHYHEVRTILQAIDINDEITFQSSPNLELELDPQSIFPDPLLLTNDNLILKAARSIQDYTGIKTGAKITLNKSIPIAAGLGGGSSDAAATLRALRRLWKLKIPDKGMEEIASHLGTDVPFFLRGGTALGSGKGEIVNNLPTPNAIWVVVSTPRPSQIKEKTARLYSLLKVSHYSQKPERAEQLIERLRLGDAIGGTLFNSFELIAPKVYSEYVIHRSAFFESGAENVLLSGSGPSLFSVMQNKASALYLKDELENQGYLTSAARLLNRWKI